MPTIKILDIQPTGYDLLSDSESYMTDLSEEEIEIHGGAFSTPVCAVVVLSAYSVSIIYSAAKSNPKSPHNPHGN